MLFSHPDLAAYLNQNFECAWQSVAPVPHARIDFGNGHRLERTLNGNIATWLCTPEGEAVDAIVGLVDVSGYRERVEQARRLLNELGRFDRSDPERALHVARFHDAREVRQSAVRDLSHGHGHGHAEGQTQESPDFSKLLVELPVKDALVVPPSLLPEGEREVEMLRKFAVESPIKEALVDPLAVDADYNRRYRDPLVHRLLREHPLVAPEQLTERLYREVLHVDLSDPYLGLAPYLPGGEPGRYAPSN